MVNAFTVCVWSSVFGNVSCAVVAGRVVRLPHCLGPNWVPFFCIATHQVVTYLWLFRGTNVIVPNFEVRYGVGLLVRVAAQLASCKIRNRAFKDMT